MPDTSQSLIVRTLANGAMAELRTMTAIADRDEARRIYAQLQEIVEKIRIDHGFVKGGRHISRPDPIRVG